MLRGPGEALSSSGRGNYDLFALLEALLGMCVREGREGRRSNTAQEARSHQGEAGHGPQQITRIPCGHWAHVYIQKARFKLGVGAHSFNSSTLGRQRCVEL